jgi:hypothetical protein
VAKLADRTVAVYEKHYARLDMAVKAKELTEFEFGKTGGGDYEFMQYVSLINRSERQRIAPFRSKWMSISVKES